MAGETRRKRQITIERHSITIIRTTERQSSAHCEHCGKTVSAFSLEQFAAFFQTDIKEICRRVEAGEFHLTECGRDVALVCADSFVSRENIQ